VNILEVKGICKSYAEHLALNEVSIDVPKQSIFGLLGPNGAGKTTLIRIINQIIASDKGEIFFNSEILRPNHVEAIGYLPEERGLYKKMKVGEQLLYFARLKGLSRKQAMEKIKKWFKKFEIADWWGKKVEDLSKGMQQKIQFIGTVMHEPSLLILDEPFSGFDPINVDIIKDIILELRDNGSTIIFSTHRMESVEELCDHIALINKAEKILDGEKKTIKEDYRTNTFIVDHIGDFSSINGQFELLNKELVDDTMYRSTIKIQGAANPNALLQTLISQTEVHGFIEQIPTMNDIFITKVKADNHE